MLQHAHNPVHWYVCGDEAQKKAGNENKLILVSINYSACHWCNVMEHKSFEDELTAKIMKLPLAKVEEALVFNHTGAFSYALFSYTQVGVLIGFISHLYF